MFFNYFPFGSTMEARSEAPRHEHQRRVQRSLMPQSRVYFEPERTGWFFFCADKKLSWLFFLDTQLVFISPLFF